MHDRDFQAAQEFLLAAKNYWTTTMFRTLRAAYDESLEAKNGHEQAEEKALGELQKTTLYRYFPWLERHLQRMKYSGRYGLVPYHSERRDSLLDTIEMDPQDDYSPQLNSEMPLPDYYQRVDIHQHPGGLWGDDIAGFVYEYGARSTTPLLGESHKDLHYRFTDLVADGPDYERILDIGCGFGKSIFPFVARFPNAQVEGIDLSAPCLLLAARTARDQELANVRFRQMNGEAMDYADESFDLVTSTMLLHELPTGALDRVLDETFRVLRPGGYMIHLDFYLIPDAFRRFLHYGHSRRNNEPYMRGLAELDLEQVLAGKGFEDIQFEQFRESEDVDLDSEDAWRFPWTAISARKPAGA